MRKKVALLTALVAFPVIGCAYGDIQSADNGKLYVVRHDRFLFGALRKFYECTPDGNGNLSCTQMAGRP